MLVTARTTCGIISPKSLQETDATWVSNCMTLQSCCFISTLMVSHTSAEVSLSLDNPLRWIWSTFVASKTGVPDKCDLLLALLIRIHPYHCQTNPSLGGLWMWQLYVKIMMSIHWMWRFEILFKPHLSGKFFSMIFNSVVKIRLYFSGEMIGTSASYQKLGIYQTTFNGGYKTLAEFLMPTSVTFNDQNVLLERALEHQPLTSNKKQIAWSTTSTLQKLSMALQY